MTKRKRIIISVSITLAAILAIYTAIWTLNHIAYNKYIDSGMEQLSYSLNSYVDWSDDIIFGVLKPHYMTFTGNLTVVGDNNSLTILLWPSFMCKEISEIGLIIRDDTDEDDIKSYMIYINDEMEFDAERNIGYPPEEEAEVRILLEKRKIDLIELFELACERFRLQTESN